jgi:hypothetical protein
MKRHQYVALIPLALAGIVYLTRPAPVDMRLWQPFSTPIKLKVGRVHTNEFVAGLNTNYRIYIESQSAIEFNRHKCLLGMAGQDCTDVPNVIDIDWCVLTGGKVIASGSSLKNWSGFYSGETIAREIGHFAARKGQNYSVVLDIRRDANELSATNPKLLVETEPPAWKDAVVGYRLATLMHSVGSAVLLLAGLPTLVLTPLFGWLLRRYRA